MASGHIWQKAAEKGQENGQALVNSEVELTMIMHSSNQVLT